MRTKSRLLCMLLSICLVLPLFAVSASAAQRPTDELQYTGVSFMSAGISISGLGRADCTGTVSARPGYSVSVTMQLRQDGIIIKTWYDSGSEIRFDESYYVTPGHSYQTYIVASVKNSSNTLVANYTCRSSVETY